MFYYVSTSCRGSNCVLCALNPCCPHLIRKPGKLATTVSHWGSAGGQHSAFARKTFQGVVIPLSGWNDCLDIPFNRSLLNHSCHEICENPTVTQALSAVALCPCSLHKESRKCRVQSEPRDSVGSSSLMFVFSGPWVTHCLSSLCLCVSSMQSGEPCHQTYCTLSNNC